MAYRMYFCVCIITAITLNVVSGAVLTTSSNTITVGGNTPTETLTLTCRASGGYSELYNLRISRVSFTTTINNDNFQSELSQSSNTIIVASVGNSATAGTAPLASRIATNGITGGITSSNAVSSSISVRVEDLQCNDEGQFFCVTNGNTGSVFQAINITSRAMPSEITMTINGRPKEENQNIAYSVGDTVRLECRGNIGNININTNNPNENWRWRFKYIQQSGGFQDFDNLAQENVTSTLDSSGSNCQTQSTSTMNRVISALDNGREIQCVARSDINGVNDNYTIYVGSIPTTPGTGNVGQAGAGADLGLILGCVFGVLAAIVIVIVLVYIFVFRRKSSGGDDYDTGEGKDNDRPPGPDVYATPGSRGNEKRSNARTAHRMSGRENDGMEDTHEKSRHYANNDFGRGRSNPAMRDDLDDSRHSYDDDNTDQSRTHMPPAYGSAV